MASLQEQKHKQDLYQSDPFEPKFRNFVQKGKEYLTYQILADLSRTKSAEGNNEGQQAILSQQLQQQNSKLLEIYTAAINSFDRKYAEAQLYYIKRKTQSQLQVIEQLEEEFKQSLASQLLDIEKNLNAQLKNTLQEIKKYLQTLSLRIKHQKYLADSREIQNYLQRQKNCVEEKRGQIEKIIRLRNQEIRKMVDVAKGVCRQKQREIQELEMINNRTEAKIESTIQSIQTFNDEEQSYYKNISQLSQNILKIKTESRANFKEKKINHSNNQNQHKFRNQNLGSEIIPERQTLNEPSQIFFPQEPQNETKCQIAASNFKNQLLVDKILILALVILSVAAILW